MLAINAVATLSERGRRDQNEDMVGIPAALWCVGAGTRAHAIAPGAGGGYAQKGYLFMLADGVGGRAGGEQASRLAITQAAARYYDDPSDDLATSLRRIIEAANRDVRRQRASDPHSAQMATTLTAAVIHGRDLYVANVGDSRAYLLRGGDADLLTHDHSWPVQQAGRGVLPDAAELVRRRNQITRSLGSHDQVGADVWRRTLRAGDRLLLCSDGLSGVLAPAQLARLGSAPRVGEAAVALVDTAYDHGSRDNISVVLVEVAAPDAAAPIG